MASFLTGSELNASIEKIFENANAQIIIISPYIKLHDRIKSVLKAKDEHSIEIIIVFGKNEDDISKSITKEDFEFLREFPNISIFYEKRLHAKYYANESSAILTSMNLYSFSQNNNIEFGVLTKRSSLGNLIKDDNLDKQAWEYFDRVIDQAELFFKRTPQYKNINFGFSTRYEESILERDLLSMKFNLNKAIKKQKGTSFTKPKKSLATGYCIRTGKEIPFNVEKPMCYEAYKEWSKYNNPDYPEKYCHFSGENSNGETSVKHPILRKNWKKAKEIYIL